MNQSGIYVIINNVNGKFYIGSAVNLHRRRITHFSGLRLNKSRNPHLQNAFNKYGEESFIFLVVEHVERSQLIEREQFWLDLLNVVNPEKGYNICPIAGSSLGKVFTEEHKRKLSEAQRRRFARDGIPQEHRDNLSKALRGHKTSEETKRKISEAHTGKKQSPETIEKMAAARRGKKQSEETIKKRFESRKGYTHSEETILKISEANKGKVLSEEHKQKLRESNLGRPAWNKGLKQKDYSKRIEDDTLNNE